MARVRNWCLIGVAGAALQCGSGADDRPQASKNDTLLDANATLVVIEQTDSALRGSFQSSERVLDFAAVPSAALAGDVELHVASLTYDLHYDFAAGEVVTDGHGAGLDFDSLAMLLGAVHAVTEHLGPEAARWPLHAQMLYAAVSGWQQSGGMPLDRMTFALAPERSELVDKSLGDDGVTCIQNGVTYLTSFDYGDTTVIDEPVQAGESDCNGMCGPSCTQLQPWRMWTLDCMEHDQCCRAIGDSTTCWTPLGECGNEYVVAESDFLRGFDPFARHCGG